MPAGKFVPVTKPTDDRIRGQAPGSSPSMAKAGEVAAWAAIHSDTRHQAKVAAGLRAPILRRALEPRSSVANDQAGWEPAAGRGPAPHRLASEGIPEAGADIVEIGPARVSGVDQIRAAQAVHRKQKRLRSTGEMESDARSRLDEVRPVLSADVAGQVIIPVALNGAEAVAGADLRIEQQVVVEPADEDGIAIGFGEEAHAAAGVTVAARVRGPATVVGRHRAAAQIFHRFAGFGAAGQPVPAARSDSKADNDGVFREILHLRNAGERGGLARVADHAR